MQKIIQEVWGLERAKEGMEEREAGRTEVRASIAGGTAGIWTGEECWPGERPQLPLNVPIHSLKY